MQQPPQTKIKGVAFADPPCKHAFMDGIAVIILTEYRQHPSDNVFIILLPDCCGDTAAVTGLQVFNKLLQVPLQFTADRINFYYYPFTHLGGLASDKEFRCVLMQPGNCRQELLQTGFSHLLIFLYNCFHSPDSGFQSCSQNKRRFLPDHNLCQHCTVCKNQRLMDKRCDTGKESCRTNLGRWIIDYELLQPLSDHTYIS